MIPVGKGWLRVGSGKRSLVGLVCGPLCGLLIAGGVLFTFEGVSRTAWAQEAVRLQWGDRPLSTQRLQQEHQTDQHLNIGEGSIESKSNSFSVVVRKFGDRDSAGQISFVDRHEVLQASIDVAGTTFEFDSANPDLQPGEAGLRPLADLWRTVVRTPVTTVLGADGKVREASIPDEAKAGLDAIYAELFEPARLKQTAQQTRDLLPAKAVKVGDEWQTSTETPLGSGQVLTVTVTQKYQGTVVKDGRTLHRVTSEPVSVTFAMDPNSPSPLKVIDSQLKATSWEGEYLFDAEKGEMVQQQTKLKAAGPLKFQINGNEVPGKVEFTINSQLQSQPVAE